MTDEQIIDAFHEMWDMFPEPVMMIKKSREIIALNPACGKSGVKPGMRCSSVGAPALHKGCRCNEAVDEKKTVAITYQSPAGKSFGFWVPVANKPEWILHFNVGVFYEYESTNVVLDIEGAK